VAFIVQCYVILLSVILNDFFASRFAISYMKY
jgi:hypothetical protein